MPTRIWKSVVIGLAVATSAGACARGEAAPDPGNDPRPHRVLTILGARDPESVRYDADPVPEPADIGVDTRRSQVAIPVSVMGHVEVWGVPRRR